MKSKCSLPPICLDFGTWVQKSSLKYLDLNQIQANDGVLNNLISACDSLEKLSLRNLTLNGKMIEAIRYVRQKLTISCFSAFNKKIITSNHTSMQLPAHATWATKLYLRVTLQAKDFSKFDFIFLTLFLQ